MKQQWLARGRTASSIVAWAALVGCQDGLLYKAAPPGPARLSIAAALRGGAPEAYGSADRLFVRFRSGGEARLEETLPFDASSAETRVSIHVPLRDLTETLTLELELRMAEQPLFRGSTELTLTAGRSSDVDVPLDPVIASVACSGPQHELTSYGETVQLSGVALFATGDTVRTASLQWSTAQTTIVGVDANTGIVTALQDGTAQVICAAGGLTDSRAVRVFAVVSTITVAPASAAIAVGATQQFAATLRDARTNVIADRIVTWTSSTAAATVSPSGLATGVAPGNSRIDASSGDVAGSASLTVFTPPPVVATAAATAVRHTSAVLNGTVNPGGFATSAWFDYSPSPDLARATRVALQSVGSGSTSVGLTHNLSSLAAGTTYYYRIGASNAGGTAFGAIVSFRTLAPAAPVARMISSTWNGGTFEILMSGGITTNGLATDAWFEWSEFADFRQFIASGRASIAAGDTEVAINGRYTMTTCSAWYVRAAAQNSFGIHRSAAVSMGQPPPCIVR